MFPTVSVPLFVLKAKESDLHYRFEPKAFTCTWRIYAN